MTNVTVADDLLIAAREVPGTATYVGVEMSSPVVTTGLFVRLAGTLQARSRSALACWAQIQTGWPSGRVSPDRPPPPYRFYYPAVWVPLGVVEVPGTGVDLPVTFTLAPTDPSGAVLFPLVRVKWILSAGAGAVLASDWVVVTAQIEMYRT